MERQMLILRTHPSLCHSGSDPKAWCDWDAIVPTCRIGSDWTLLFRIVSLGVGKPCSIQWRNSDGRIDEPDRIWAGHIGVDAFGFVFGVQCGSG